MNRKTFFGSIVGLISAPFISKAATKTEALNPKTDDEQWAKKFISKETGNWVANIAIEDKNYHMYMHRILPTEQEAKDYVAVFRSHTVVTRTMVFKEIKFEKV